MPNPSPTQNSEFKNHQFRATDRYADDLSHPISIRLPRHYLKLLRQQENPSAFARECICREIDAIVGQKILDECADEGGKSRE